MSRSKPAPSSPALKWPTGRQAFAALILSVLALGGGCSDDTGGSAPVAAVDAGVDAESVDVNDGDVVDAADLPVALMDVADEPPSDTAPEFVEDVEAQDTETRDAPITNPSEEGQACLQTPDCDLPDRVCLEGVCTLVPASRTYVEVNYVLEQPEEISAIVSVLKGFVGDVGFFMTALGPLSESDAIEVTYGGADPITEGSDEELPGYAFQRPESLPPTFFLQPFQDPMRPFAGDTWRSERFTYELVALFDFNNTRNEVGFVAIDTFVTMQFSPDGSSIERGNITGYITREQTEDRLLTFGDDCESPQSLCCIVTVGVCPTYSCGQDAPLESIADILDCNGAMPDVDLDETIPGNDAYFATIFFASKEVQRLDSE